MRMTFRSSVVGTALLAVGFAAGAMAADPGKGIVQWALADLKWEPRPGGPAGAAAWSAPNGSHCDFAKFAKGTKEPLHTHTTEISAVILAGQFGSAEEGKMVKFRGAGSYQFIPAGLKHTTECGADAECIIFICQPGAFDLVPAEGGKK